MSALSGTSPNRIDGQSLCVWTYYMTWTFGLSTKSIFNYYGTIKSIWNLHTQYYHSDVALTHNWVGQNLWMRLAYEIKLIDVMAIMKGDIELMLFPLYVVHGLRITSSYQTVFRCNKMPCILNISVMRKKRDWTRSANFVSFGPIVQKFQNFEMPEFSVGAIWHKYTWDFTWFPIQRPNILIEFLYLNRIFISKLS